MINACVEGVGIGDSRLRACQTRSVFAFRPALPKPQIIATGSAILAPGKKLSGTLTQVRSGAPGVYQTVVVAIDVKNRKKFTVIRLRPTVVTAASLRPAKKKPATPAKKK